MKARRNELTPSLKCSFSRFPILARTRTFYRCSPLPFHRHINEVLVRSSPSSNINAIAPMREHFVPRSRPSLAASVLEKSNPLSTNSVLLAGSGRWNVRYIVIQSLRRNPSEKLSSSISNSPTLVEICQKIGQDGNSEFDIRTHSLSTR
jgi:hypothetical protein